MFSSMNKNKIEGESVIEIVNRPIEGLAEQHKYSQPNDQIFY